MVYNILLIGSGNVGSRHLQALVKIPFKIQIDIIEPKKSAKELSISRLNEINYDEKTTLIVWHDLYNSKIPKSNVVIVATLSKGRSDLLNKLIMDGHTRILSEKILCQSKSEFDKIIKTCKKYDAKIWVNTNPRCFASYKKLKKLIPKHSQVNMIVNSNPELGMGTNAIHYIDLFSWLNDNYDIKLDGAHLLDLLPNKRGKDFIEFSGTVIGILKNHAIFVMSFLDNYPKNATVKISTNTFDFYVDETAGTLLQIKKNKYKSEKFTFEHVSSLTKKIVMDIITSDSCCLPTISESYDGHLELFKIFNHHIFKKTKKRVHLCPIT